MTEQEKQTLANDLCSRLRFGIKAKTLVETLGILKGSDIKIRSYEYDLDDTLWINGTYEIDEIKPYLRPMSSVTEEEMQEYQMFIEYSYNDFTSESTPCVYVSEINKYIDWLNAHHFDYRGLIEKGLALEVPEGMYE